MRLADSLIGQVLFCNDTTLLHNEYSSGTGDCIKD